MVRPDSNFAVLNLHFFTLIVAAIKLNKICKRRHRFWVQKIYQDREKFGFYNTLIQELRTVDQKYYFDFLRMTPDVFEEILKVVSPYIERQDTFYRSCIPAEERLALTLRFLATGQTYKELSVAFRIGKSTIQKIIPETCEAIWNCLKNKYLKFPANHEEWLEIAAGFDKKWQLPHCCGSIEGRHILRKCSKLALSSSSNYKGISCSVLLAIADSDFSFIMVDYGHYGGESDDGIFRKTLFGQYLNEGQFNMPSSDLLPYSTIKFPFFIIGDESFPLKRNLLRPFPKHSSLFDKQKIYNYRINRGSQVAKNAFGVLAAHFRIFNKELNYTDYNVRSMVLASCALHNMLIQKSDAYCPNDFVDHEDHDHHKVSGIWRTEIPRLKKLKRISSNMYSTEAKELREVYSNYLCDEGTVPWQNSFV